MSSLEPSGQNWVDLLRAVVKWLAFAITLLELILKQVQNIKTRLKGDCTDEDNQDGRGID